jgi:uncharacterized membrane protein YcaP (DUF421 family)
MGKREIGQLGIIDLIVSILIAELVAISIENSNASILFTIIPIVLLVILEMFFAFISMKSRYLRLILDGKPSLLIYNGILNYKEMVKQKYNLDDLLLEMRQKEIYSIEEIEYAFLEPNGKLSLFKYNYYKKRSPYPMPLIMDGRVNESTLKRIRKTREWLFTTLINKKIECKDIFYAFYNKGKIFVIKKNN